MALTRHMPSRMSGALHDLGDALGDVHQLVPLARVERQILGVRLHSGSVSKLALERVVTIQLDERVELVERQQLVEVDRASCRCARSSA